MILTRDNSDNNIATTPAGNKPATGNVATATTATPAAPKSDNTAHVQATQQPDTGGTMQSSTASSPVIAEKPVVDTQKAPLATPQPSSSVPPVAQGSAQTIPAQQAGTAAAIESTQTPNPTIQKSAYDGPDWSNGFDKNVQEGGVGYQMRPVQAYESYNKWAKENGKDPLDVMDWYGYLSDYGTKKTFEQTKKDEKALERKQRWEKIGNLLSHLGNFVGTLYGAPSQTIESGEELNKRQQALRDETTKMNKDTANSFLANMWKEKADQRANDLNNQKIGVEGARQKNIEGDTANDKANADATVNAKNQAAGLSKAREVYELAKNKREQGREAGIRKLNAARANASNASAEASHASAGHSRAETRATNQRAYGQDYEKNRYRIWSKNRRRHPDESRQFMKDNNIHSTDMKNWTKDLIDQYNGYISDKEGQKRSNRKGGAASLLD